MNDKLILLVEGSPDDRAAIIRALRRHGITSHITTAQDGQHALDQLFGVLAPHHGEQLLPPDLILLNLHLPRLDGLEVLRIIRADRRTHWVPVILLTDSDTEQDLLEAYRLGANHHLAKSGSEFQPDLVRLCAEWLNYAPETVVEHMREMPALQLGDDHMPLTLSLMQDIASRLASRIDTAQRHGLLDVSTGLVLLSGRLEGVWRDAAPLFEVERAEVDAAFAQLHGFIDWLRQSGHTAALPELRTRDRAAVDQLDRILQILRTSHVPS